ncbi:Apoptosis inhibitor 5 [Ranunculus cassubicifolius]
MADVTDEANDIEKLYEYGERLNESKDKSQNVEDYQGIIRAAKGSTKAKQLAAQMIPRFFKHFPSLADSAVEAHFDLCEEEELGVRVQAIRGLPLLCKDTPEYVSKIVDVLGQLLTAEENVERDAVHKSLMSLLRQDVKASLSALFKHIESSDEPVADETLREKVLSFIRDKVFPLRAELLKPPEQAERHITDLVKKSLQDVTGAEFKMFMDFLRSLTIFGESAPPERVQELIEIIEGQADLHAQFNVSDGDHIDRLISCLHMALPFFMRGASNSKFVSYLNKHIIPVFDQLPEERKLDLLKNLAESSPYTTPQDSRQLLPSIVQLLKKYMPRRKSGEETNFTYVECLLYTFHHLSYKTPNATNSLCGYKIVTGQPSDRLGEDFSENFKDFTERLINIEDLSRVTMKKLTQGMAEHNKAMTAAKTEEEKATIKTKKLNSTTGLRTCNNILSMTKPLHVKTPSFIGDKKINLSWKEGVKSLAPSTTPTAGAKRTANAGNGSNNNNTANKKGRGDGGQKNQLVNRAFQGLSRGGGGGRNGGGGRGYGGRGRGRGGYY